MALAEQSETSRLWWALVWSLRIGVALQCLGNWRWLTQIEETPLLHWLINPNDIGGLAWSETTALATQQTIGWLVLLAGLIVLVRPCAAVLGPVTLLQVTMTIAMWRSAAGFPLAADWLPGPWLTLFPFATQAARVAAPLGLMLLDPWRVSRPLSETRVGRAITLLRWAAAVTFMAHGVEALQLNPEFTDLLIGTNANILGVEMSQGTAERILQVIGVLDVIIAVACLATRSRCLFFWMALWGVITAWSRLLAAGLFVWHMPLVRTPHIVVPLAVALYWHLIQYRSASVDKDHLHQEGGQIV